jgi:hypothetical protein
MNDLSDEAWHEWCKSRGKPRPFIALETAQEWRRRAEAIIEERERDAYYAGMHAAFEALEDLFTEETCDRLYRAYQADMEGK